MIRVPLLLCALGSLAAVSPPAEPLAIGEDLTVRELLPRALVVTHEEPFPANTLVVELEDGTLAIVGSPYSRQATESMLAWLRARFGARPLLAITTHFHPDGGPGGNAAFLAAGATVYTSDLTRSLLAQRGDALRRERLASIPDPRIRDAEAATPWVPGNRELSLAGEVDLAGGEVRVIFPGATHSPDNVAVYFPRLRILSGADMIRGTGTIGYLADADLASWPKALARLRAYPAIFVVPGHGKRFDPELLELTAGLFGPGPK